MEELSTLLVGLYDLNAKLIYGIKYLKENEVSKDHVIRYCTHINNIGVLHKKIKGLKESMGFPMFSFTDFKEEDFEIKDGFLHGNISIARKYAQSLLSEGDFFKDENSLKKYELSLCINHLADKVESDKTKGSNSESLENTQESYSQEQDNNKETGKDENIQPVAKTVLNTFGSAFNF